MKIIEKYDLFIFDLDGVIYTGEKLINKANLIIEELKSRNKKIYYLTNNSTKSRENFKNKLNKLEIFSEINQIITSAYATAAFLNKNFKNEKKAFVIGQNGIKEELLKFNFEILKKFDKENIANFVIVGLDQFFNYEKLANGLHFLIKGSKFIATNDDPSLPTENLPLPGAGSMVKALEICSGKKPLITIGKPNDFMINLILEREQIRKNKAIIIGDRLRTDILAGINAKIDTLLVKTGSGEEELNNKTLNSIRPNYIKNSISEILD
ncbi:MAG: HAD-IIA family hydrolase [Candidatus Lokiarchaeota archaeon]|nr:HAD-IIA family hydrolase [Candidatus Lokiarchaeota archaeon]